MLHHLSVALADDVVVAVVPILLLPLKLKVVVLLSGEIML